MPGIYLAPPSTPSTPPDGVVERSGLEHVWTGWDDTEWRLSDEASGVRLLRGYRGLTMPPITHLSRTSPALAGSRHRGVRISDRPVFWPLYVFRGGDSQAWLEYDRAWWRTMRPTHPGEWTVVHPDGTRRSLRCRFVDDGQKAFELDPVRAGWAKYAITMTAEEPFWRGTPITRSWRGSTSQPFFGTAGGPPFHISSSHTLASASIENPGDEDAWLDYTIIGPSSDVSVGIPGRAVQVGWNVPAGRLVRISTDPSAQTAFEIDTPPAGLTGHDREDWIAAEIAAAGVEKTNQLVTVRFAPVPALEVAPLDLHLTGTGSVEVSLTPLYHRAW